MAKTIKSIGFTKKDEELVEKITAYRRKTIFPLLLLSEAV